MKVFPFILMQGLDFSARINIHYTYNMIPNVGLQLSYISYYSCSSSFILQIIFFLSVLLFLFSYITSCILVNLRNCVIFPMLSSGPRILLRARSLWWLFFGGQLGGSQPACAGPRASSGSPRTWAPARWGSPSGDNE